MKKELLYAIYKGNVHIGNVRSTCPSQAIAFYLQEASLLNSKNQKMYSAIKAIKGIHYF